MKASRALGERKVKCHIDDECTVELPRMLNASRICVERSLPRSISASYDILYAHRTNGNTESDFDVVVRRCLQSKNFMEVKSH